MPSTPKIRRIGSAIAAAGLLVLASGAEAEAESRRGGNLGLGLVVGEPTGLSLQWDGLGGPTFGIAKLGTAVNVAVGIDFLDEDDLYVHADYVLLIGNLVSGGSVSLPFYAGLGGFFVAANDARVGARMPFGVQLEFHSAPVHIFGELAARLTVIDDVDLGIGGAIGFRYFF